MSSSASRSRCQSCGSPVRALLTRTRVRTVSRLKVADVEAKFDLGASSGRQAHQSSAKKVFELLAY